MRPWASASLVLVLALAMAGCSGGGADADPTPTETPSGTTTSATTTQADAPTAPVVELLPDFAFRSCRGLAIQALQPLDQVQALLPDGFTAAAAAPAGGAPPTDPLAIVGMDLYVCGNLTTPDVTIAHVAFGMLYTHIERPADRVTAAPPADVQEYAFRILSGQDVLAALWPAAGYDTYSGATVLSISPLGSGLPLDPGSRMGEGRVDPDYFMLATSAAPAAPAEDQTSFARYTALGDGSVLVWTGQYSRQARGGQGSFQVADDDPFAGFEQANNIPGHARLFEAAELLEQDLSRHF